jgi:hypothetical protein
MREVNPALEAVVLGTDGFLRSDEVAPASPVIWERPTAPWTVLEVAEGRRFGALVVALTASDDDYPKALVTFRRADLAWHLAESRAALQVAASKFAGWVRHVLEPVPRSPLPIAPMRGPPSPRTGARLLPKASRRTCV